MAHPVTREELDEVLDQRLAEAVSKLATKDELAEAVSKLATKDELAEAVSKLATKEELDQRLAEAVRTMMGAIERQGERLDQRFERQQRWFEELLATEVGRHIRAAFEQVRSEIRAANDPVRDHEQRIDRLEKAVFKDPSAPRRRGRRSG